MNAATEQQPAVQTSAARALKPEPEQPARFAVMGLLRLDARTFTTTGGVVILEVLITQHLQLHPEARHVLARLRYPDQGTPNSTAAAAHSKAMRMRAGVEVVATGSALYAGHHQGQPVTVLDDVAAIEIHTTSSD